MFLYIVSVGASNRLTQEHYSRSGDTVSYCFHQVLDALNILHEHIVRLDRPQDKRIAGDSKYAPYFGDCIGALDGTHVSAFLPSMNAPAYRNRKGTLSQNVLGVCTFDMQFSFVYPGWEGSAHDTRVVEDARARGGFDILEGKYYLADAGYLNAGPYLSPYRGTRYHLREQALANLKPSTYQELFNLRHLSLRNIIERIFSILKRTFKCLNMPIEYLFDT